VQKYRKISALGADRGWYRATAPMFSMDEGLKVSLIHRDDGNYPEIWPIAR